VVLQTVEAGTFSRASEEVLKQRKIIRARRPAIAPSSAAPPAGANPFAGIQLSHDAAAAPSAKPFANVSLIPPTAPSAVEVQATKPADSAAGGTTATEPGNGESAAQKPEGNETVLGEKAKITPPTDKDEKQQDAVESNGGPFGAVFGGASSGGFAFGSLASGASGGAAGTTGGFGALSSASGGFGGLAAGSAPAAFGGGFGSGGFGSGGLAFGSSAPATTPAANATDSAVDNASMPSVFGSAQPAGTSLFGGGAAATPSRPELPPQGPVATGEENERSVFTGDAVLYAYDAKKQWRQRGSGSMKVNVKEGDDGLARLVMRQKGTLRVLMNASLWAGMTVSRMEGGQGVTFAVDNRAEVEQSQRGEVEAGGALQGEEEKKEEQGGESIPKLTTYAVRIKPVEALDDFVAAIEGHKGAGQEKKQGA
jgi:Ran-binding protein 3